jgi:xanthine phosphoribosyltransferase
MEKIRFGEFKLFAACSFLASRAMHLNPDVIVGIERGGIPLALFLSSYLNLPLKKIKVSFYDGETKLETPTVKLDNFDITKYKKPLFVDDLVDSGSTMNFLRKEYGNILFATLLSGDKIKPDIYFEKKTGNQWIVFPWDLEKGEFNKKYLKEGWWV